MALAHPDRGAAAAAIVEAEPIATRFRAVQGLHFTAWRGPLTPVTTHRQLPGRMRTKSLLFGSAQIMIHSPA